MRKSGNKKRKISFSQRTIALCLSLALIVGSMSAMAFADEEENVLDEPEIVEPAEVENDEVTETDDEDTPSDDEDVPTQQDEELPDETDEEQSEPADESEPAEQPEETTDDTTQPERESVAPAPAQAPATDRAIIEDTADAGIRLAAASTSTLIDSEGFDSGVPSTWGYDHGSDYRFVTAVGGGEGSGLSRTAEGSYNLLASNINTTGTITLTTPKYDLSNYDDADLSFSMASIARNSKNDTLTVSYRIGNSGDYTKITSYTQATSAWLHCSIQLNERMRAKDVSFRFTVTGNKGYGLALDKYFITGYTYKTVITPTITVADWTYRQPASTPVIEGNVGGGTETIEFRPANSTDWSNWSSLKENQQAGSYEARVSVAATDTTRAAVSEITTFTIEKADRGMAVAIDSWVIDEDPCDPEVTGHAGQHDYELTYSEEGSTQSSTTRPTTPGNYVVRVHIDETTNYVEANAEAKFTISDIAYECTEGEGSTWTQGSSDEMTIRVARNSHDDTTFTNHFKGAQVDGSDIELDKDYTAEAGSVIVKLKAAYLGTLSVGDHVLTLNFDDGSVDISFTVKAADKPAPQTGDGASAVILVVAGILIAAGGVVTYKVFKKKEES